MDAEQVIADAAELREREAKLASLGPEEWMAGTYKATATFVSATSESVTLRKENCVEVTVPLERLDDATRKKVVRRASDVSRWKRQIQKLGK